MFVSRGKRKVVSLAVAMALVSGTWIPILADGEDGDQNVVKRATYGGNPVVFGDIDTSNSGKTGLEIVAEHDDNFIVSVGSINAGDEAGIVMSNSGGTVDLTVTGNITAYDGLWFAEGMNLEGRCYNGVCDANIKASITGNIVASGGALLLDSYGESVTDVSVTGNLSAMDIAVNTAVHENSDGKVTINGSVTSETDALYVGANGNSSNFVSVVGDVSGGDCGVNSWSRVSGKTDVSVTGTVSGDNKGIHAEASKGTTSVNVNGEEASVTGVEAGLDILVKNSGKVEADIFGDVNGLGEGDGVGMGIHAETYTYGQSSIKVTGDVTANEAGIVVQSYGKAGSDGIPVEQHLEDNSEDASSVSDITIDVNGDVDGGYVGIDACAGYSGSVEVLVNGDLFGDDYGLLAEILDGESALDILVAGTMTAGRPVQISSDDLADECDVLLTAWKIVPTNDDGIIAERASAEAFLDQDEDFEKAIGYIIRYEQPEEHGTFTAVDEDGNSLGTSHGFDVANEGDTILIHPDLEDGYEIVAAYNGVDEKTPLPVDEDGNFYLIVPRGGGVYLSVDVDLITCKVQFVDGDENVLEEAVLKYGETPDYTGPEPTKKETEGYTYEFDGWDSEFKPVTGDVTYTAQFIEIAKTFTLSFDLNGGSLDGKTGKIEIKADYASSIKLPAAPTREGYTFLYWKGSQYDASADYVVQGDHTFTAEWEEVKPEEKPETEVKTPVPAETPVNDTKDTPSPNPEETPTTVPTATTIPTATPSPTATPVNAKPKTGDSGSGFEWLGKSVVVIGLAMTAFVAVRNIRRKEENC